MTQKKPLSPMEREEKVGIVDGSDHAGETVTRGRHGFGPDVKPEEVDEPTDAGEGSG